MKCASDSRRVGDNKGGFPLSRNFSTCANKTEAMHEMSHVSIKVEPRSRLSSTLLIRPLFYLRD